MLKIDLSKAYDRVDWLDIRMLLTHLGFGMGFIRWMMSCVSTTSFVVLVNRAASPFFHAERGLRQGCPLSPLLFLFVAEVLSIFLENAKRERGVSGAYKSPKCCISHTSFSWMMFSSSMMGPEGMWTNYVADWSYSRKHRECK